MSKTHVAILRGGPSEGYDISLNNGAHALDTLPEEQFTVRDIFIDRNGTWHKSGIPRTPAKALEGADVVLNMLSGEYGEDGAVQKILTTLGVPFIGSDAFAAATVMDKSKTHRRAQDIGVRVPPHTVVTIETFNEQTPQEIFNRFGPPYVVKPLRGTASLGITIAQSINELVSALIDALNTHEAVLVEQYINGTHMSVGVVERLRDEDFYVLPPAEILLPEGEWILTHEHKLSDSVETRCPSQLSPETKKALEDAARALHKELGLRHFSRFDFVVGKNNAPYLLEANTLTELTPNAPFTQSLDAVGVSLADFLAHAATLAQK